MNINSKLDKENLYRVTVAIPTFNRFQLLKRAVLSVLNQNYSNLEIIISDNASTDGTREYLQQIDDPRVKVNLNSENQGMVGNWECCLNLATGSYFLLLSDDDALADSDTISKVMRCFEEGQDKIGMVFTDFILERVNLNANKITTADRNIYNAAELIVDFYNNKVSIFPCGTYIRTNDLRAIGGYKAFNARLAVDACAWITIAFKYDCIVRIAEPLTLYRIHESLTFSPVEVWSKDFEAVRKVVSDHKDQISLDDYKSILSAMDSAWRRIPIGYIVQRWKYDQKYGLNSLFMDIIHWRKRLFSMSNLFYLLRRCLSN